MRTRGIGIGQTVSRRADIRGRNPRREFGQSTGARDRRRCAVRGDGGEQGGGVGRVVARGMERRRISLKTLALRAEPLLDGRGRP
jgi:hypothetical protein